MDRLASEGVSWEFISALKDWFWNNPLWTFVQLIRQYLFKVYCILGNVHKSQHKLLYFSHCHIRKNTVIFCYIDEAGHYGSEVKYLPSLYKHKNDRLKTRTYHFNYRMYGLYYTILILHNSYFSLGFFLNFFCFFSASISVLLYSTV